MSDSKTYKYSTLLTCILMVACGQHVPSPHLLTEQQQTRAEDLYVTLATQYWTSAANNLGHWPYEHDCDGSLWAGDARAAGLLSVDESLALQPDGRPTRLAGGDCLPSETAATTSTDGRTGIILGLLAARDLSSLKRLESYITSHSGIVGTPASSVSLTLVKPVEHYLLARAIHSLGGPSSAWELALPVYTTPTTVSDQHLQLLDLLIQEMTNSDPLDETESRSEQDCSLWPSDALALAICGDFTQSANLALLPDWPMPGYIRQDSPYELVYKLLVLHILTGATSTP